MSGLRALEPLDVAPLFAPLHRELLELLRSLPPDAWARPTLAPRWRVRDVAAHLLDGDLRKLAAHRDGHLLSAGDEPPKSYDDVVSLINSLNTTGVAYAERLSPRLLVDLLDITGTWVSKFVEQLDPSAPAVFAVAWAGESESQNWMDTGREYTERWHHQAQIREAVDAPLLLDDSWYEPLLSFSMRALPRAYAGVPAAEGTSINIEVGDWLWCLVRDSDSWRLYRGGVTSPATTVRLARNDAWRLFYNAPGAIVSVEGDRDLAGHLLATRSVMV